jgi:hypothetical protein
MLYAINFMEKNVLVSVKIEQAVKAAKGYILLFFVSRVSS